MAELSQEQSGLSQGRQHETSSERDLPGHVEVSVLPMSDLPDVNTAPKAGMDFWTRDLLRPDMEGPNWHNIPIAEFWRNLPRRPGRSVCTR